MGRTLIDVMKKSKSAKPESENGSVEAVAGSLREITGHNQTEKALRESEERLRLATEAAQMYSWEFDTQNQIYKFSENAASILGVPPGALPQTIEDTFALVHPGDRERIRHTLTKALKTGEGFALDFRSVKQTGETVWLSVQSTAVKDAAGKIVRIIGIAQDVTQRKQDQETLHESELQMRLVVEAAEMGTWDWNLATGAVRWNEQHFRLFGLEPEDRILSYKDFERGVHPDDREAVRERLEQAIAQNGVFETEFRAVFPDGTIRWMNGYGRVVEKTNDGRAARMAGVMFDATERKRAEEDLRESEERLRLVTESAVDYAIITTDFEGIVKSWSAGAEKIFGFRAGEIVGHSGDILFTSEDRKKNVPEKEMRAALRAGRAEDERWHVRRDGSRFYASGVMRPLKDGKGFAKIARDQTEKIRAEKALQEKKMLQRLIGAQEDERKRIARDLHDHLGQQLTALRLKLESARKICDDEALCDQINATQEIAKRIDAEVDFLAWELRPAALDDLGLAAALENYVREWSHHTGIAAEIHASGLKRPRLAPEIDINLYRIAQEALNNVYKHARAGRAAVMLEKRDGAIILIVEDDGAGFNLKSKTTRQKGLGLIGMKERATLVGGTLEIESAPGKGTTIFVRMPIRFIKKV